MTELNLSVTAPQRLKKCVIETPAICRRLMYPARRRSNVHFLLRYSPAISNLLVFRAAKRPFLVAVHTPPGATCFRSHVATPHGGSSDVGKRAAMSQIRRGRYSGQPGIRIELIGARKNTPAGY